MSDTATASSPSRRLTFAEAAEYLGLTQREFRSVRDDGKVPAIRYGHRTVRFDTRDLDALMERCRAADPLYRPEAVPGAS